MQLSNSIIRKIYTLDELKRQMHRWKLSGKKIVFTNGVFDLLHDGHITLLLDAAAQGDKLIVGINSDTSVKKLKGNARPVNNENTRSLILASLLFVDAVILFVEDTPHSLITSLLPDVLVKGGDYTVDTIVGAKEILANGGQVRITPILEGYSTTSIIDKLKAGE